MHFELPAPGMTFDVALADGATIRMRRHGNPDGVRLLLTHGNGFAADAYYPYWQYLLQKFDLLVFDFRNHGQNLPVVPSHHTYEQLTHDLERVVQEVKSRLGARPTAGLFHSMSGRTAMKHAIEIGWRWDALLCSIRPMCRRPDIRLMPRWPHSRKNSPNGRGSAAGASPGSRNWPRNTTSRAPRRAGSTARMN
jgi:pimeloyl-ACP methyl ester carboxylesterase